MVFIERDKILAILLLSVLSLPWGLSAAGIATLKIGKDYVYFQGVKSTSIRGLNSAFNNYRNSQIIVFLCTNGNSKKLMDVMNFLDEKGITDVTLRSSHEPANC